MDDHHDLYRALQSRLDRMPVPFPPTASGVERRILQQLYSPADVRVALCLSMLPEPVSTIARRYRRTHRAVLAGGDAPVESMRRWLDDMAARGLAQRVTTAGRVFYGQTVFVVGFYEAQVNRLTPELQRDVDQYADEGFARAFHASTSQLRTVPVNTTIPIERIVGRYDDIRAYVARSDGPFAVMPCVCQQGKALIGEPCRQTSWREHCLMLGGAATATVERGDAQPITKERCLDLLERADREGLVVQPQNTQHPLFICCCCGCCCGVLSTARRFPEPAALFAANYRVGVDAESCVACGACVPRCQMDALAMDDLGRITVDVRRCIGCGLCVSTCPGDALRLAPITDPAVPPTDTVQLYLRMFVTRFGWWALLTAIGRRLVGLRV